MRDLRRALVAAIVAAVVLGAGLAAPAGAADPSGGNGDFVSGGEGSGGGVTPDDPGAFSFATGSLIDETGSVVGDLAVFDDGDVAEWIVSTDGVAPGLHALQLHDTGLCQPPFDTAGDRVDSTPIPPISVAGDGTGFADFSTASAGLDALADGNGFSLVLLDLPDNRANVPTRYTAAGTGAPGPDATSLATGDAGDRIACAVAKNEGGRSRARTRWATRARIAQARRAGLARLGDPTDLGRADLVDSKGNVVGRADLAPVAGGEGTLQVIASGLKPGVHGLQIHAVGRCRGSGFSSAGAKVADIDLPDLVVGPDGVGFEMVSATLPGLASLLAGDGASLVVQAGPDNHANIPNRYTATGASAPGPDATTKATGDAGANVECGRIRTIPLRERFITSIYNTIDERDPEPAEVAKWTKFLASHSNTDFVDQITRSVEGRATLVRDNYDLVLGTEPSKAQLAHWVAELARPGFSETDLISYLAGSDAFYELVGGTVDDYVVVVFESTVGRDPGRAESGIWTAYLQRGGNRATFVDALLRSTEARTGEITSYYESFTGVDPDPEQLAAWLTFFRRGGDGRTMRTFLLGGPDYYEQVTSPNGFLGQG